MRDWKKYVANTKGKAPDPSTTEAFTYTKNEDRALDLGAGAMSDTAAMIEHGFKVIDVVDAEPAVAEVAEGIEKRGAKVNVHITPFHEFPFHANTYDFINAMNAIPFAGPEHVEEVMEGIKHSMKRWGVFCGTFFGYEDEWADDPEIAIHSREAIEEFFNKEDWNIHKFDEVIETRPTSGGKMKRWHVFTVIASCVRTM